MPKPANPELKQTIEEILLRQVNQSGIDSLSMRNIANEANVTATTVYYYFDSKEKLIDTARSAAQKNIFDFVSAQVAQKKKPRKRLESFIRAFIDWSIKNPNLFGLVFEKHNGNSSYEQFETKFQIYLLAHEIIYTGKEQKAFQCVDPSRAALICLSSLFGVVRFYLSNLYPGEYAGDIDYVRDETVNLLNKYLRKKKK